MDMGFAGHVSWSRSRAEMFTAAGWVKYEYITGAEYIARSIISHLLAIKAMQKIFCHLIHWSIEISVYGIRNDAF